jgi:hypothetical protein
MIRRSFRPALICGLTCTLLGLALPAQSRAGTTFDVAAGWDLFQTVPAGTSFPGLGNLMGVPLNTFDFDNLLGRGLGVQNTGSTDTIIERTAAAIPGTPVGGSSATVGLLMNALQLETVAPVDPGTGLDNYFVTLQSTRGGPASTGTITITWDGTGLSGTFTSSLDVFFDIRKGSLGGAIVMSSDMVLSNAGATWSDIAPPGAELIRNANLWLSGTGGDPTQDFWPSTITEAHPNGTTHMVNFSVPEPASLVMFGLGAVVLGAFGRRRFRRAA